MKTAYILLLSVASCATLTPPLQHRVCAPYITVGASPDAPPGLDAAVASALAYWEHELGQPVVRASERPRVVVRVLPLRDLGRTHTRRRAGCVQGATVLIGAHAMTLEPAELETVMRHELGHVLGLQDAVGIGLMAPRIVTDIEHPHDATIDELMLLYEAYGQPDRVRPPGAGGDS